MDYYCLLNLLFKNDLKAYSNPSSGLINIELTHQHTDLIFSIIVFIV